MTFPAYPDYRDSAVEWLGEVPEHWAVHPLKRAIERIESGTSVNAADLPAQPGSLGVLKTSCVYTGKFDWTENKTVDDEDLSRVSCPLRKDTLIVSRMNTPDLVGATGLVTEAPNGIFLPDRLWQVYVLANQSPEFIFYFTKSREYREQVKMACSGTSASMQNLGQDDFRDLLFAEPPKTEQTQIAHFLDHEVASIDALIEEQQRLIELLEEKRQAVISHAVTKGVDPTMPMKDSGVEWLGEVPVHWEIGGLTRFIGPVVDYRGRTPTKVDDGIFLVTARNIRNGRIDYEASEEYADPESAESLLARGRPEIGDLLFTMEAPLGQVALIDRTDIALAQRIVKFRGEPSVMRNHYLMFWFMSKNCQARLETLATGSTALGIKSSKLGMIECLAPTLNEQDAIISHVQRESEKNDALVYEAENVIGLLQERRSALISAAVTGKIDVRGWQSPASALTPELAQEAV